MIDAVTSGLGRNFNLKYSFPDGAFGLLLWFANLDDAKPEAYRLLRWTVSGFSFSYEVGMDYCHFAACPKMGSALARLNDKDRGLLYLISVLSSFF